MDNEEDWERGNFVLSFFQKYKELDEESQAELILVFVLNNLPKDDKSDGIKEKFETLFRRGECTKIIEIFRIFSEKVEKRQILLDTNLSASNI